MSQSDAQKALVAAAQSFLTAQGFASDSVNWENQNFDPAGKPKWASVFYVPNQPNAVSMGRQGLDRITGFLQIDFNVPQGSGDGAFHALVDAARLEFSAGKVYTRNGVAVIVESTGISQGRIIDNFFRKSLTIVFRADLQRP
jgi:hypothetical protein